MDSKVMRLSLVFLIISLSSAIKAASGDEINPPCRIMFGPGATPEFVPVKANFEPGIAHSFFGTTTIAVPKHAVSPYGYVCVASSLRGAECAKGLTIDKSRAKKPCVSKVLPLKDLCDRVDYTYWEAKEREVCLTSKSMSAEKAVKLAERKLFKTFGVSVFEQRPFVATKDPKGWRVVGTLHCPHNRVCKGGVGEVLLDEKGEVISVSHGK